MKNAHVKLSLAWLAAAAGLVSVPGAFACDSVLTQPAVIQGSLIAPVAAPMAGYVLTQPAVLGTNLTEGPTVLRAPAYDDFYAPNEHLLDLGPPFIVF